MDFQIYGFQKQTQCVANRFVVLDNENFGGDLRAGGVGG